MPSLSLLLQQAAARLAAGPHPERARLDAETLLLHHLGKNRAWLLTHLDDDLGGCTAIACAALVERRAKGEPIQYIAGECEFYGLPFRVTPDVLIPRPETEHLVEAALAFAKTLRAPSISRSLRNGWETNTADSPSAPLQVVDVGTGSGAIAVALAKHLPDAHITAVDLSPAALAIARENAGRNAVSSQIRFLESDLLAALRDETFDIIVSNPPYVPAADRATLSVEVRDHEPALALFAGDDGLAVYRRLIPQAFAALGPGGRIVLEIGYAQQPAIQALLAHTGFDGIEFLPDLQGIARVATARRP